VRLLRNAAMGLSGLAANPFRTALAALGIVIGVAAVVALTSLGNGVQKSISGQINDLGSNLITVSPGSESGGGGGPFGASTTSTLTPEDARRVAALPSVSQASSVVSVVAPIKGRSISFSGVDPTYAQIRSVKLLAGRFVEGSGEVVLAPSTAEDLFETAPGRPGEAVGRTLEIGGPGAAKECKVVGVSKKEPAGFGPPSPATSYMSTLDALDISGAGTVGQIIASANSAEAVGAAKKGITAELRKAHGGAKDFSVFTQKQLLSTFTQVTDQLQVFLAGIAGISLLVGGIGIMNIMLVSVAERTKEIGVRKALGATDSDVLLQFLFEAVLLAVLGGFTGVAIGITSAELLPRFLSDLPRAVVGWPQVALAFGVSALVGVVFGSLPAYRSARLAPVEALRRE
jgi:putative ABC transport system permease protein